MIVPSDAPAEQANPRKAAEVLWDLSEGLMSWFSGRARLLHVGEWSRRFRGLLAAREGSSMAAEKADLRLSGYVV